MCFLCFVSPVRGPGMKISCIKFQVLKFVYYALSLSNKLDRMTFFPSVPGCWTEVSRSELLGSSNVFSYYVLTCIRCSEEKLLFHCKDFKLHRQQCASHIWLNLLQRCIQLTTLVDILWKLPPFWEQLPFSILKQMRHKDNDIPVTHPFVQWGEGLTSRKHFNKT